EDEALALGEIKVALESAPAIGNVDLDVAQLHVAQAEAARIDVGIELSDDVHFADRAAGSRSVGEANRVGQGLPYGHELLCPLAHRSRQRDQPRLCTWSCQEAGQTGGDLLARSGDIQNSRAHFVAEVDGDVERLKRGRI